MVLCADVNANVRRENSFTGAIKGNCGLINAIEYAHPSITPPNNTQTGTHPVDGIFISPALHQITRTGWLKFGAGIGDHRALYVDIPIQHLLGEQAFTISKPHIRRLQCSDPRIIHRYNQVFDARGVRANIFNRYKRLQGEFSIPIQPHVQSSMKQLYVDITHAIRHSERKCRKIYMGNIPYTDDLAIGN